LAGFGNERFRARFARRRRPISSQVVERELEHLVAALAAMKDADARRLRLSEALSLVDEDPTYGYLPPVYYYVGLAREGLHAARFADSYHEYLNIRGTSTEDPLVLEVRRRVEH
jgi:hypothetical protein